MTVAMIVRGDAARKVELGRVCLNLFRRAQNSRTYRILYLPVANLGDGLHVTKL